MQPGSSYFSCMAKASDALLSDMAPDKSHQVN
jgi:hypothetical protein